MIEQKQLEKIASKMTIIGMIVNILNILIWSGLAIFFEKWWLTLLSIFFMQNPHISINLAQDNEKEN